MRQAPEDFACIGERRIRGVEGKERVGGHLQMVALDVRRA